MNERAPADNVNVDENTARNVGLAVLAVGLALLPAHVARAEPSLGTWERFDDVLPLVESGEFAVAAGVLADSASAVIERADADDSYVEGATLYALSTICFERGGRHEAYRTWANAIRYCLEIGSDWERERLAWRSRLEDVEVAVATPGDIGGGPPPGSGEGILLALEEHLRFTTFEGPEPGLNQAAAERKMAELEGVARTHHPRPLKPDAEEGSQGLSRRGALYPETDTIDAPSASAAGGAPALRPAFGIAPIEPEPDPDRRATPPPEAEIAEPPADTAPTFGGAMSFDDLSRVVFGRRHAAELSTLDEADLHLARTAWQYFVGNRQPSTGLFDSVDGYSYTTMWDVGSSIAAIVCADQLGVLAEARAETWLTRLLQTLAETKLYNDELPNREYHTKSGEMVDFKSRASAIGTGWSALDIGRLLVWLRIVREWYPDLASLAEEVVARWDFTRLTAEPYMRGAYLSSSGERLTQEGRLGYEQYAASAYSQWGLHLPAAQDYDSTKTVVVEGVDILADTRGLAYLTSEPFYLGILELGGVDSKFLNQALRMFEVQRRRYESTGILTCVSEDSISESPWFVYNTVYTNGRPWECVTNRGKSVPEHRTLSAKGSIAWDVIVGDEYTARLREEIQAVAAARGGVLAGIFEATGEANRSLNINTNAVILEALLFKMRGFESFLEPDVGMESRSRHG